MYLGNFTQGREVLLPLLAVDDGPTALWPTAAPRVRVYDADGTLILAAFLPACDRSRATGLFVYRLALDDSFVPGRYHAYFAWTSSGVVRARAANFDVVAGGDADGAVVSLHHLGRPQGDKTVAKTDGGKRLFLGDPRV